MTKRSEEANAFREAQKEALEEMEKDSSKEKTATTSDNQDPNRNVGDITDLPTQLEQELRLLQRRTTGFIDIEVQKDVTFATIKYETGYNK